MRDRSPESTTLLLPSSLSIKANLTSLILSRRARHGHGKSTILICATLRIRITWRRKTNPSRQLSNRKMFLRTCIQQIQIVSLPAPMATIMSPFFRALREAGYDERIIIECGWKDFAAEIGPSLAHLKKAYAQVNQ